MRQPARWSNNARRHGRTSAEYFGMDLVRLYAQGVKTGGDISHEIRRSADVIVAIAWQAKAFEHSPIQAAAGVEICIELILGIWRAVADVTVRVDKLSKQRARLLGKRMFAAASRSVEPPYLSCRCFGGLR